MSIFTPFLDSYGLPALIGAAAVFFLGGLVKGAVGFALPLIVVSLGSAFLPGPVAVALLIAPTFLTNAWQATRRGPGEALAALRKYWLLNAVTLAGIALCAPLLLAIPPRLFYLTLGAGVLAFCALRAFRIRLPDPGAAPKRWEAGMGAIAGFYGGLAGTWGPPVLMYLIARGVEKREQVVASGVTFFLGSAVMALAHGATGAFNAATAPVSVAAAAPTLAGMALGVALHDRLDQRAFGRLTLLLLAFSGLNLLRKAVLG